MKLIFIFCLISSSFTLNNDVEVDKLFDKRWVRNSDNGDVESTLDFELITANSLKTESLPMHIKFAGITFEKDGTFIEHVWNKCGTGNPPDHFKSNFQIIELGSHITIKITNSRHWDGEYKLLYLTEGRLRMKRTKAN
jgi:hypothetical protein